MVRHILGISGGKDSAALAIYLKNKYPQMKLEYYNTDTGCELAETELLISRLETYLGGITMLRAAAGSPEPTPFEHFLKASGNYLPSPQARWCTPLLKRRKSVMTAEGTYLFSENVFGLKATKPSILPK